MRFCLFVGAVVLLACAPLTFGAMMLTEGWDNGQLNGFDTIDAEQVTVLPSGGNPDGFVRLYYWGPAFPLTGLTTERDDVTGDYAASGVNELSIDVRFFDPRADIIELQFIEATERLAKATFQLSVDEIVRGEPIWTTFSFLFDPNWSTDEAQAAGWVVSVAGEDAETVEFNEILSNVGRVNITAQWDIFEESDTRVGFDNFTMAPTPGAIAVFAFALSSLVSRRRQRHPAY